MFDKDTYIRRRRELKKLVGDGVIVLFGNNNSPANFPNNGYHPFRQDSSFLYYFGQQSVGHVGIVTDVDPEGNKFSFVHASSSGGVRISSSNETYYSRRYIGARRIVE